MHETSARTAGIAPEITMRLRPEAKQRARDLGYRTDAEIAEFLGIGRSTLDRWCKGETNLGLNRARFAANRLGLTVDSTFEEVTSVAAA